MRATLDVVSAWHLRRLVVIAAATSASCSLFVDLGDLSAGARAGDDLDGSVIPHAGEASASDAGAGDTRPDGPSGRFCDAWPGSRFCTDFDGVTRASLPIDEANASVTLSQGSSVSPPTSLAIDLDTPTTSTGRGALSVELGQAGPSLHVGFDIRISEHSKDYTETLMVRTFDGASSCAMYIVLVAMDRWDFWYGCPGDQKLPLGPIPFGSWVNVALDVDATTGKGTIAIDGNPKEFEIAPSFAAGTLNVFTGVYYAKPQSGPIRLALDNVVVQ